MTCTMFNRLLFCFATCLTVTALQVESLAQINVVSPSEARDGGGDLGFELEPGTGGYVKAYSLYRASDFDALPASGAWIVGYGDRADTKQQSPATYTATDMRISMSTVQSSSLSKRLSDNVGDDSTVVLDVDSSSTTYVPSSELPNTFETGPLNTPFFYNPADGNLVVEYIERRSAVDVPLIMDYQSVPYVGDAVAFNPNRQNANFVDQAALVAEFIFLPELLNGDMNFDGNLDVDDLDALTAANNANTPGTKFDVNGDGTLNKQDRAAWIHEIKNTYFGDANMDGEFNSGDLTEVFKANEYEDNLTLNSTWSEGDWNGDGDFDSGDLVEAFKDGGYEIGPRTAASPVPEPSSWILMAAGLLGVGRIRKQ